MGENEGIRVTDAPNCLLCRSKGVVLYSGLKDRLFGTPGIWMLMQCPKCQLVWINPQPDPVDIGKLYAQYFTHQIPNNNSPRSSGGYRKCVRPSILNYGFGYRVEGSNRTLWSMLNLIGPFKDIVGGSIMWLEACEKGRLLDVGCGNGIFLGQMRQLGWEVAGVEPDEEAVSIARDNLGLEVFHGSLEDAKFEDGCFDAVTMNHVIEHLQDPVSLLKECRRVLKPGGKLIVVTPNTNSLGFRLFGENWRGLEVPRHLLLFSPPVLRTCAEAAGLNVQKLRTTAKGARWMWAASYLLKREGMLVNGSPGAMDLSLRLQKMAFSAIEQLLSCRWDVGEEIVVEAVR